MFSNFMNVKAQHNIQPNNISKNTDSNPLFADDWSHDIYLHNIHRNKQLDDMDSCKKIWNKEEKLNNNKIEFEFGKCHSFDKIQIEGRHENIDLILSV